MKLLQHIICFGVLIFVCILIYGNFYQHKDNHFSSDLIIIKNFYNSKEMKLIKEIIKNHNMKSKLILDSNPNPKNTGTQQ